MAFRELSTLLSTCAVQGRGVCAEKHMGPLGKTKTRRRTREIGKSLLHSLDLEQLVRDRDSLHGQRLTEDNEDSVTQILLKEGTLCSSSPFASSRCPRRRRRRQEDTMHLHLLLLAGRSAPPRPLRPPCTILLKRVTESPQRNTMPCCR